MAGTKKRKSLDSTSKKLRKKHVNDTAPPADDVTSDNEGSPSPLQSCSNKGDDDSSPESAFYRHLGYTLKDEEVVKLNEMDWKYKWKMAATGADVSLDGDGEKCFEGSSYQDILHCNKKPFYYRGRDEDSSFMDAYILHALNHVYHTRELVTKNDSKLTKHQESTGEDNLSGDNFLDQGFTRPKGNVEHIDRFNKEFGPDDEEDENEENDGSSKSQKPAKPVEYQMLFGGNTNDHFVIGIKFTKRSLKLYSDFYSSDIIVASPLGLITKIGDAEADKLKDVDYLSSIELLIVDHTDVIAMQNWSHLKTVVEKMNHTPSKQHGTDVMRIRQWYLNGHARYYRQTILLGSYLNPDMCGLFNQLCLNHEGKVILKTKYEGVLPQVLLQVRQVYERFDVPAIADADDARLDYFCKKVFPKIQDSTEGGILIFISSSLDHLRVKHFFKCQEAPYCEITEFSERSDIPRTRNLFNKGDQKIMLYTERAYFYHRYKIRGVKNIIFYSLPERKEFFPEITDMLEGSKDMVCRILYSRFDLLSLQKIVGTDYAKKILSSDKGMFVCTS